MSVEEKGIKMANSWYSSQIKGRGGSVCQVFMVLQMDMGAGLLPLHSCGGKAWDSYIFAQEVYFPLFLAMMSVNGESAPENAI